MKELLALDWLTSCQASFFFLLGSAILTGYESFSLLTLLEVSVCFYISPFLIFLIYFLIGGRLPCCIGFSHTTT